MTLMERVGSAQAESGRFVSDANAWMLEELKDEVGAIIAGDTLASLAVDNPKRARSELKSAMRSVFRRRNGRHVRAKRRSSLQKSWSIPFSALARCNLWWKTGT